jgi:hypothetical protein
MTDAEWRKAHPNKADNGNMRNYATIERLLVLANLENVNALYINKGMPQAERIEELNRLARSQMAGLLSNSSVKRLKALENGEK